MLTEQVYQRALAILADPSTGLNATLASLASGYGLATVPTFDFSAGSRQLYDDYLDVDTLERYGEYVFPLVAAYATSAQNQNLTKFCRFDGPIQFNLDFHLAFYGQIPPPDARPLTNALEEALVLVLNTANWSPLIYNAEISFARSPLTVDEEKWRRTLRAQLTIEAVRL